MAVATKLCAHCARVPFQLEELRKLEKDKGARTWNLGTVRRIRSSDCPLCNVISFRLYEEIRTQSRESHRDASEAVLLSWHYWGWPGKGCFVVDGDDQFEICFISNSIMDFQINSAFCLVPNVGQAIDLQRVKGWVSHCTSYHGGDCSMNIHNSYRRPIAESFAGLELIRFIDVQKNCIVQTRLFYRYVALSYVWGLETNFRLTTSNMIDLIKPNSLNNIWHQIPRTIRDAIMFVRGVGERYLWVDALCLLQNDTDDATRGVNAMDFIYENALVTVVAACGHDANHGLPGVEEGTRFMPRFPEEIVPGVKLDVLLNLDRAMKNTVYNSRAWTYGSLSFFV